MPFGVELGPEERSEGHAFSNVEHTSQDLATMRKMASQLVDTYEDPKVCDFTLRNGPVCQSDPQGRHFRIYYIQADRLFRLQNLAVVGFFGEKRPNAKISPLLKADKLFEAEFHNHPDLLSLSTVRVANGNFANLVVFANPEGISKWNNSAVHRKLVAEISPPYYLTIRLNNGWLPRGLDAPDGLWIERVKYIDYSSTPYWRAVRTLAAGD
ncbi:MAG: hypothetical protein WBZ24_09110 [Anaerolineales bacterium]|jgi:hypothetical protein